MYQPDQDPNANDFGPEPFVAGLACLARRNPFFRRTLWTGCHLQLTLMCIPPCGEIGLEVHPEDDQFLCIVSGCGTVRMGPSQDCLTFQRKVGCGSGVFVPAGTWHNLCNTSGAPLKLYSIYAPPHHPHGTVHRTKAEADTQGD